ncbi:zinc finger, LSD1-type [Artemisia annua]|uniref:Zinc finger, LSD1-type n=1 Tax=Artemisia annua TaxID=35608 RepID=A0A2U1QIK6_ARTAN|nr:zinc finger, LSD1-type [Artemisia annua]
MTEQAPPENHNTVTEEDQPPSPPPLTNLDMEEQYVEDDGPPPGWDNKHQLKEETEPAAVSSDMKMEDERQDVQNEEGPQPGSEAHPSPVPELVSSDITVDHQDSEDEGPPPGWDSRSQSEPKLEVELPSTPLSGHMEADDVQKDAQNDDDLPPQSQAHTSQLSELVASDMQVEQHDSEDEGPPPGWDSKCQPESESQLARPTTPQSDIKMMDVQQDAQNEEGPEPRSQAHPSPPPETVPSDVKVDQQDSEDEGPPPGWDSKCQPGSNPTTPRSDTKTEDIQQIQNEDGRQPQPLADPAAAPEPVPSDTQVEQQDSEDDGPPPGWDSKCESEPKVQEACPSTPPSDTKTGDVQLSAQNEDGPEPQSLSRPIPAPELVISDTNVEEQDSEDDGPPPGWDSKCLPEQKLQKTCSSDSKMEDDQRDLHDDEGPPPGWEPTPQQESQAHLSVSSPVVQSGGRMDCEQINVKAVNEIPQPPSRQRSITPIEPQVAMSKRPRSIERSITPIEPQIPMPKRQRSLDNPEMGQMVCGSCRLLLSYPRGARYVECACCLEENYVLEEHEVGQVVCGSCDVLLMYPYGAPKIRCNNCKFETEIGDQNRRPPLSEHKKRARQHLRRVQAG